MANKELRKRQQSESEANSRKRTTLIGVAAVVAVTALAALLYWVFAGPREDSSNPVPAASMPGSDAVSPLTPVFEPTSQPGTPIADLPDAPGAQRTSYSLLKPEPGAGTGEQAEYNFSGDIESIKKHYLRVFREKGWTVVGTGWPKATWSWTVNRGKERAKIALFDDKQGTIKVIVQRFQSEG